VTLWEGPMAYNTGYCYVLDSHYALALATKLGRSGVHWEISKEPGLGLSVVDDAHGQVSRLRQAYATEHPEVFHVTARGCPWSSIHFIASFDTLLHSVRIFSCPRCDLSHDCAVVFITCSLAPFRLTQSYYFVMDAHYYAPYYSAPYIEATFILYSTLSHQHKMCQTEFGCFYGDLHCIHSIYTFVDFV
jgi:hypothetical protein